MTTMNMKGNFELKEDSELEEGEIPELSVDDEVTTSAGGRSRHIVPIVNNDKGIFGSEETMMSEISSSDGECASSSGDTKRSAIGPRHRKTKSRRYIEDLMTEIDRAVSRRIKWRRAWKKEAVAAKRPRGRRKRGSTPAAGLAVLTVCKDRPHRSKRRSSADASAARKIIRDFDERRKELLESLKKKEESQKCDGIPLPDGEMMAPSEIQEVEMEDDSNMCEDRIESEKVIAKNLMDAFYVTRQVSPNRTESEPLQSEEDDEEQLRMLALKSNRRKTQEEDKEEMKNELELRAEALKTAVLKKHSIRLKRSSKAARLGDGVQAKGSGEAQEKKAEVATGKEPTQRKRARRRSRRLSGKERGEEEELRLQLLRGLKARGAGGLRPPSTPPPGLDRIIVHLGDDSSDDEPAAGTQPSAGSRAAAARLAPTLDCEKSVEQFLSRARQQMEARKGRVLATPEAVYKHLPPSQRAEYIRLKQKIAEKEKLKTAKIEVVPKKSTMPKKVDIVLQKKCEQKKLELIQLKNRQLKIDRLKLLLKKIRIEKSVEEKLEKEMKKLKTELVSMERKMNQQKLKIRKMADESKAIYQSVQMQDGEKKGTQGAQEKQKATEDKKGETDKIPVQNAVTDAKIIDAGKKDLSNEGVSGTDFREYSSPLEPLHQAVPLPSECSKAVKLDPNLAMCQFDLLGTCNDEECPYQHYRVS